MLISVVVVDIDRQSFAIKDVWRRSKRGVDAEAQNTAGPAGAGQIQKPLRRVEKGAGSGKEEANAGACCIMGVATIVPACGFSQCLVCHLTLSVSFIDIFSNNLHAAYV